MKYLWILSLLLFTTVLAEARASSCGGSHSHASAQEMAESYFDQMDSNGDKVVDENEFKQSSMAKMIKSFDALQPDKKGLVTRNSFVDSFVAAHSAQDLET